MKYLNEFLLLLAIPLITYGIIMLASVEMASLLMGILFLLLAVFKPIIEAIRGTNVATETAHPQSTD